MVRTYSLSALCGAVILLSALGAPAEEKHLSSVAEYRKYIDPLLQVKDFGIHYYDDGAADATVLFPQSEANPWQRPRDPVIALIRLGPKSFPLLIDCLGDGRLTNVEFDGNTTTNRMKVPVGYVCLDILMGSTRGRPMSEPDCADDGLGACMNYGYYFRPDDYYHCVERLLTCNLRPWVGVVQQNWRRQFLQGRLHFHNPYDDTELDEYREFRTPRK